MNRFFKLLFLCILIVPQAIGAVLAYKEDNYEGGYILWITGDTPDLDDDWNDKINSIEIEEGTNYEVVVYEHSDYKGDWMTLYPEEDQPDLDDDYCDGGDGDWGNAISSIKLLEKSNFQYEGRMRRATLRKGKWMDDLRYSILSSEFK